MDVNALIKKLWHWFDNYFLLIATAFLIVFIPLYPKIPLAEIIPGYIVRLRLEDIFIALAFGWWFIQLLRRRVTWKTPLSLAIILYLVVGFASNILGVYVTNTIPAEWLHFGKSTLHWLRHVQYFSLFFIAYNAVNSRRQAQVLVGAFVVTLLGVMIYGYGQKYWYWPVYSTMNREFSKGLRLYLGEHARVQSTFAGHYDLGGYLVLLQSLVLSVFYYLGGLTVRSKKRLRVLKITKILTAFAWFGGLWLLVMSASRASFGGYLVGAGIIIFLYLLKRGWWWGITRGLTILLISAIMFVFVGDLSTRFAQIINQSRYPQLTEAVHTLNNFRKNPLVAMGIIDDGPPSGSKSTDELEKELNEQGMTVSDTQPSTQRPTDVYTDVPEKEYDLNDPAAASLSGLVRKGDKLVQERVYSDCSLKHSLSVCIRIETLWPRALQGFYRNPLVGSGYATLTKTMVGEFTEAESTDNNFLRTLGENGALGFFFFYGSIGLSLWYSIQVYRSSTDKWLLSLAIANIAGITGLLLNAMYIDVFVASKIAYTFWTLQGVIMGVFVKEGAVAPQFAFARRKKEKEVSQLSSLLAQAEKKAGSKTSKSKYLADSKKKRRQRSTKRSKKQVQR